MPLTVNTNVASINTLNHAGDDADGLAVAENLNASHGSLQAADDAQQATDGTLCSELNATETSEAFEGYTVVSGAYAIAVGTGLTVDEPGRMLIDLTFTAIEDNRGCWHASCKVLDATGIGRTKGEAIHAAQKNALLEIHRSFTALG